MNKKFESVCVVFCAVLFAILMFSISINYFFLNVEPNNFRILITIILFIYISFYNLEEGLKNND